MNTLSNVKGHEDTINSSCGGLTSDVILKVQSCKKNENSNIGVSSFCIPVENNQWYVLRATYNRVEKGLDLLKHNVADIYLPKHYRLKQINGEKKRVYEPLIPNMIFVYSSKDKLEKLFKDYNELSHFHFYRDKTKSVDFIDKKNPPMIIPYHEMLNFIKLTSVKNEHIMLVEPKHCHYKSGDIVRIIDGDFVGIEGRVARVAGQQRVVIEMKGICFVATAYIPSAFISIV